MNIDKCNGSVKIISYNNKQQIETFNTQHVIDAMLRYQHVYQHL